MIRSVKFNTDYRCFKEGTGFTFRSGLNFIVGDNGCGKSTLLSLLTNKDINILDIDVDLTEFYFLDLEHNNPRTANYIERSYQISARFSSHGESNNALLNTPR
jgi:predicted ATP-binding protein involved in virulence